MERRFMQACAKCQLPGCPLSVASLSAASLSALLRCQGKLCKLRCKVGNTFWPRPKPDCAANELIAHMQTHALSLSLSLYPTSLFPLSLSAAACIHFHLQHLLVDTLRPSASSASAAAARPKRT